MGEVWRGVSAFRREAATTESLGPELGVVLNTQGPKSGMGKKQRVREGTGKWDSEWAAGANRSWHLHKGGWEP